MLLPSILFREVHIQVSVIIGTYSNSGNSLTKISYPRGVHVDSSGNVYVADSNNHRVLKLQVRPEITIAAGATTGTVIFTSLSDFDDEDDETIIITPSTSPINANKFNIFSIYCNYNRQ